MSPDIGIGLCKRVKLLAKLQGKTEIYHVHTDVRELIIEFSVVSGLLLEYKQFWEYHLERIFVSFHS